MEVEIFYDVKQFVFQKNKQYVGHALFKDLKLNCVKGLADEDKHAAEWLLGNYQLGEVLTDAHVKGEVLGPARIFELEVMLRACGNPDHQQYADVGPKKTVRVCSVSEAVAATMAYQHTFNMGQGNCHPTHGKVWRMALGPGERRKHVGFVTLSGRYETIAERKATDKLNTEKYKTK